MQTPASISAGVVSHIGKQNLLDMYFISPSLIPQPKDWRNNNKIIGFINVPASKRETHHLDQISPDLRAWLDLGDKPIYIGFGSNGVGNPQKFVRILNELLKTNERILFCTGWAIYHDLPEHKNLFVTKYVNHEAILPKCKIGIFHGGAGTLAAMLRNNLPIVIISFYTDQPTWGKIVTRMKLGVHIPVKKLTADKLKVAISVCQSNEIKQNVISVGQKIRNEKGLENAVTEIETYFGAK